MVKILEHSGQYRITIPKEVMKLKGWKKGMILNFQFNKETREIKLVDMFERMIGGN